MVTLSLIALCLVGLLMLIGLGVGIILIIQSNQRDSVSTAREDWLHRRSEKDQTDS